MDDQIINLGILNTISELTKTNMLEILYSRKRVTYNELLTLSGLSKSRLTKELEDLQKYLLIRGELSEPENGHYAFYILTDIGIKFHSLLHQFLNVSRDIKIEYLPDKFIIDADSFKNIIQNSDLNDLQKKVSDCKIIFTNSDYAKLISYYEHDEKIYDYLFDSNQIIISNAYVNTKITSKKEYYLRTIKKLNPSQARLIATANDINASLISNDPRVLSSAKSLGIICATSDDVLSLKHDEVLQKNFYNISLRKKQSDKIILSKSDNSLAILTEKIEKIFNENDNNMSTIKLDNYMYDQNTATIETNPDKNHLYLLSKNNNIPENILANSSLLTTKQIIIKLNDIRNEKQAKKIAYDVFKSMGKIYERKYNKEIQDCLSVLDPIMLFVDRVFDELRQQRKYMNKFVQNSFDIIYAETKYLDRITKLDTSLKQIIENISSVKSKNFESLQDLFAATTIDLNKQNIFSNKSIESFYAFIIAKRKLEQELDWSICALDKNMINSLLHISNNFNNIHVQSTDPSILAMKDETKLNKYISKQYKKFSADTDWNRSQILSLFIKNNSKNNDNISLCSNLIPNANDLGKVLEIPKLNNGKNITPAIVAEKMDFTTRMAKYYLDSAEMLKLIKRVGDHYETTKLIDHINMQDKNNRSEYIHQLVLDLPIIKVLNIHSDNGKLKNNNTETIAKFLENNSDLSPSTSWRRASTITSWLNYGKNTRIDPRNNLSEWLSKY